MTVQPSHIEHKRIKREKKTIDYMVELYCRKHHGTQGELCLKCQQFKEYAHMRLDKCPFQEKKSTCAKCLIHCYNPEMKTYAKEVMRYSGPRLLLSHPLLALHHVWDGQKKPLTLEELKRERNKNNEDNNL